MNTTTEDINKIADYRAMLALTNISNGTLLTCVRESGIFGNDKSLRQYSKLDEIRLAWRIYTANKITSNYDNWMESWNSFVLHTSKLAKTSLK